MTAQPNPDSGVDTVALLGLGEAGSAIARGLRDEWRGGDPRRRLVGVDIALTGNARGPAIRARAEQLGVSLDAGYGAVLAEAQAVFSVVTGVQAAQALTAALPHLRPGTLFLDVNTLTGPQAAALAAQAQAAGIDYVDIAAMGGFATDGHRAPFLLAGPAAQRAATWMTPLGFNVRVLSDRAGDASAVKILRSIMTKGIEALAVECLVAAHRSGLVDEVMAGFDDIQARTFQGFLRTLTVTHLQHARRRMEEVDKVNENLFELGMTPLMSEATRRSHARTVDADVARSDDRKLSFEEALQVLSERVVGHTQSVKD
ncbi:MAG: NAD(P)-dependent oxidoreductase [Gammaproteobacteria bacterium]|nr:NAD(P)-dependent oxidoreductase [Gammaproteobacteria bacterium]